MGDNSDSENKKRAAAAQTRNAFSSNILVLTEKVQSYRKTLYKKLLELKGASAEKKKITAYEIGIKPLTRKLRNAERNLRAKTRGVKVENQRASISPGFVKSRILLESPATKSIRESEPYLAKVAEIETVEANISNPSTNSKARRVAEQKLEELKQERFAILMGVDSNPTYIRVKQRIRNIRTQLEKKTIVGQNRVNLKEELKARKQEIQDILVPQNNENPNTSNNANNESE